MVMDHIFFKDYYNITPKSIPSINQTSGKNAYDWDYDYEQNI